MPLSTHSLLFRVHTRVFLTLAVAATALALLIVAPSPARADQHPTSTTHVMLATAQGPQPVAPCDSRSFNN